MKFGKTLDYSMMLTAPLRESLHWKSYKMPRPDQPDGLRRMPGPGRVHQGPGQEVLHQPGGILEGSTVPEDRRAVWEPDVTFLPRCKCSGGGGLVKIEMAGAGADIANIHWAEGNATAGVLSPWTRAWRLGRLLDIFHFKITHLLVKIKFRYFCYDTIVLMYYLVLHCVSSCLVLGRECNDLQVYPHMRNVRGICQPIAHHIVVFKPLCCSDCQSDLGWQLQDTGTR